MSEKKIYSYIVVMVGAHCFSAKGDKWVQGILFLCRRKLGSEEKYNIFTQQIAFA